MNTVSECTLSASRILRTAPVECGFGHCAATVDCTGPCKLKDAIVGLPVISPRFLDEQISKSQELPIDFVLPDADLLAFSHEVERFKAVTIGVIVFFVGLSIGIALW